MSEVDITRHDVSLTCNKCKKPFFPYGENGWSPMIDEVACPNCGEKRILYYGNDSTVVKMIASTYGLNKEISERIARLEETLQSLDGRIQTINGRIDSGLAEAKDIMTEALIKAVRAEIEEHERQWHNANQSVNPNDRRLKKN